MKKNGEHVEIIRAAFLELSEEFLSRGCDLESLERVIRQRGRVPTRRQTIFGFLYSRQIIVGLILPICLGTIVKFTTIDRIVKYAYGTRCFVPNNYFIWEFTRPVSNCEFCRDIDEATILTNLTKKEFERYAYSSRPMIVKGAAAHWPAGKIFSLEFFRKLYESVDDAYSTIDEECQFLSFKSNFEKLQDVLEMDQRRALNLEGEETWYVGWKNCHPRILEAANQFYETPHFFPDDAEVPATNYIFLGYEQGAIMHLDYIPRLMWQGQIIGSKTWTVAPTPECESVCKRFNFSVDTGDIVLLDTRIWYHGTYVDNGNFSLTITSEYG